MQTSACPNSDCLPPAVKPAVQAGFTLIEILVVMFIVTVLAGLTVAGMPGFVSTADLDTESRRLELLFNMARSEAVLDSREYGFRLTRRGYEFLLYDDGRQTWTVAEPPFHSRDVHEDVRLTLRADNEALRTFGEGLPPVLILSSGEMTPFRLSVESRIDDQGAELQTDGYGSPVLEDLP